MGQSQLIIKGDRSFAIFNALATTGIVIFIGYDQSSTLFNWKHFHPNGLIVIIVFLSFLALCLMSWVILFYDPPRLKLDEEGIWKRKNMFSHSLVKVISWKNIYYYYVEVKSDRTGATHDLVVRQKDPDEEIRVGITDISVPPEEILNFIKRYAVIYGFNDLVGKVG